MNEFLRLEPCDFLCKRLIKGNVVTHESHDQNEI